MHDENVQAIADYFRSGIKPEGTIGKLGVEIEHIVVGEHSCAVSYSEDFGIQWILEQLASEFPDKTFGDGEALIGLAGGNQAFSLEPAGQLELSAGPYEYAAELRDDYERFQKKLDSLAAGHDRRAIAIGYHPTSKAAELELIPKSRYRFMDAHFAKIGSFGRCMMRGSAATQVSVDYYSEQDCLRKLRLASGMAPLLALICDNSPVFEGAPRTHHMVRTEIWQKCDPARCGTVSGCMNADFTLEDYAEYVLRTPAIFGYDESGNAFATEKSFDELFADRPMTQSDVEHALSLFFNDARLKTYLEIRPADSMPIPFVAAYATMLKGLFYYNESLDALDELLEGVSESDIAQAKEALMADGYDATVYGRPAAELADALLDIARTATPPGEGLFLNPLVQLITARRTLAMMLERKQ